MSEKGVSGKWKGERPGWGLLDPYTNEELDPIGLVTDKNIEVTPWEVHDFAVQVVADYREHHKVRV